jgi:hypothetical protein
MTVLAFAMNTDCAAQPKTSTTNAGAGKTTDPYELPQNDPIDLLERVKLPDHNLRGTWKRQDGALICEPSPDALVMVPVAISGGYELDCEFTRRTNSEAVAVIFPIGPASGIVVLSGWGGAASGIALLNGRDTREIPLATGAAVRPGKLANGQRHKLHIEVAQQPTRAAITATFNGQRFIAWQGHPSQVSCWPSYALPCPQAIGVLVYESVADIHKLELTVKKTGKAIRLTDDFKSSLTVVADAPPKQLAPRCLTWNSRKYFISEKPMDFPAAQRLAAQLQGRLLTISSADENAFILKEGRGVGLWMSGWRHSGSGVWRDERNRPLRYFAWTPGEPSQGYWESCQWTRTADTATRGWDDIPPWHQTHACIEWGEEYPDSR